MTLKDLRQRIGAQLSRIETKPKFLVSAQYWSHHEEPTIQIMYYPETKEAKIFYQKLDLEGSKDATTPALLIDGLTVFINNYLNEYVISNAKELEL